MTVQTQGYTPEIIEAQEKVRAHIAQRPSSEGARVTIVAWEPGPWGYRVAEVDWWKPDPERGEPFGAGATSMQSDPDAANLILCVERAVITLAYLGDEDLSAEALADLDHALKTEPPALPQV